MAALGALAGLLVMAPAAGATIASKPFATWQTNGRVLAIMQIGSITYVGGKFTQVSDHAGHSETVSNLAAFNAAGNWAGIALPAPGAAVKALATDGAGTIFFGGSFTKVTGQRRNHVAAMDTSGNLLPKSAWSGAANGDIEAFAVEGSTLYMGGTFTTVENAARSSLAAVALSNGALRSWSPSANGRVDALGVGHNGEIVAGGFFSSPRAHLAAFDASSGHLAGDYVLPYQTNVVTMAVSGGRVYVGTQSNKLVAFDAAGHADWTQQFDGNVQALAASDGEVVAGGHYDNVCALNTNCVNPIVRHHIAAFDPSNGHLDTGWAPAVNSNLGVFALADTSIGLAVGGDFTKIAGVSQAHLAWMATGSSVPVDTAAPTITAAPDGFLRRGTTIWYGHIPLLVRYAARDASGVCTYSLQRRLGGGSWSAVNLPRASAASRSFMLVPSAKAYQFQMKATDCVGNATGFRAGPTLRLTSYQDPNGHIQYTRAWHPAHARRAYGHTLHMASKAGAYARLRFWGRRVAWVATRAANRGTARVYIDGRLAARVNLHSRTRIRRRIVFTHGWPSAGTHWIKVVCAGTHGHPAVDVDAFVTVG
ncbi:MAG TPA: PQQ-binding-like beta-propeller repeat protein [Gaiellales bacterium]|nr:PQQ-binding-like beta-propeller repeat protein [Gaiellales bacterium]